MSEFLTRLVTTRDVGADKFQLTQPLVYRSDYIGRDIQVPAGYKTDLASVPRLFRSLIPQVGKHIHAAVVHDVLCDDLDGYDVTQAQADKIFREAMVVCGVPVVRRNVMYAAVRGYQGTLGRWF